MRAFITNNGTHSPEDWAVMTAEIFMPLPDTMDGGRKLQALKLRAAIAEAMVPHHTKVHTHIRERLKEKGDAHFAELGSQVEPEVDHYLDDAMASVMASVAASKDEKFIAHFNDPEVQAVIRDTIARHFRSHIDVEQQHHADKHPHQPNARAYKLWKHPETAAPVASETAEA